MAWRPIGAPKNKRMTKHLAEEWQALESLHIDRPFREKRLRRYIGLYEAGLFRPVQWAKCFVKSTSKWVRLNGQHTSKLFTIVDLNARDQYAVIEEYECDTPEDLPSLYATFDSQDQARNRTDINHAFAAMIPEFAGIDATLINLIVSALHLDKYKVTVGAHAPSVNVSPADKAEELFENVPAALWFLEIIGRTRSPATKHLLRYPVVAAMIGTWRKAPQKATEFWTLVRDATGAQPGDPDRLLNKWLCESRSIGHAQVGTPKTKVISVHQFYVTCIRMWNGWRKGEHPTLRYSAAEQIPAIK